MQLFSQTIFNSRIFDMLTHVHHLSRRVGHGVTSVICPPVCIACLKPIVTETTTTCEERFCGECRKNIVAPLEFLCWRCGEYTARVEHANCQCCRHQKWGFQQVITLGRYADTLRELVLQTKREIYGETAIALAELLAEERGEIFQEAKINAVLSVPMFWQRRTWRGVSAPDLIAITLAKKLGCVYVPRVLRRKHSTQTQANKTAAQRKKNVRDAFIATPHHLICGKTILLVDDVITTGATCHEAARKLLASGAEKVIVATIARATMRDEKIML